MSDCAGWEGGGGRYLGDVTVEVGLALALEVRDGRDQTRPELEEVVDRVGC